MSKPQNWLNDDAWFWESELPKPADPKEEEE